MVLILVFNFNLTKGSIVGKRVSKETKGYVLAAIANGESAKDVANNYEVSLSAISKWKSEERKNSGMVRLKSATKDSKPIEKLSANELATEPMMAPPSMVIERRLHEVEIQNHLLRQLIKTLL